MSRNKWTNEKLFYRLLNNKSDKTYWDNIGVLRNRTNKETFNRCVELTKSEKSKERQIGIDILAQLGIPPRPFIKETMKLCFELLEIEKEPKVIMSLLYSIGHNNQFLNNSQIETLCSLKKTDNKLIKDGLFFSLLAVNDTNAINTLIFLSNDKLSHIRNWATFGIGTQTERNNKKIREALWNRVNDKHQETKLEAIIGLVNRKEVEVKEIIKREILNGEYGTLLFDAILQLNDKELIPLLKQQYVVEKENKDINPEWLDDLKYCINELEK